MLVTYIYSGIKLHALYVVNHYGLEWLWLEYNYDLLRRKSTASHSGVLDGIKHGKSLFTTVQSVQIYN
jgi:hypothetical protein